jgi:hypothetical protein
MEYTIKLNKSLDSQLIALVSTNCLFNGIDENNKQISFTFNEKKYEEMRHRTVIKLSLDLDDFKKASNE